MSSNSKSKDTTVATTKLSFSLGRKKKPVGTNYNQRSVATISTSVATAFHYDDDDNGNKNQHENTDVPKEPLVIPLPKNDTRNSLLLVQDRIKKVQQYNHPESNSVENIESNGVTPSEDQAAIEALKLEASGQANKNEQSPQIMMIEKSNDTFQGSYSNKNNINSRDSKEQFQEDLDQLPENVSVDSQLYKAIPISEFGAAMLRGMGWTGDDNADDNNKYSNNNNKYGETMMPRPSRLGLGATPKMLLSTEDAPDTHGRRQQQQRRPRRHDQVQREERLRKQQEELEQIRKMQVAMDKQQTMQVGSIVYAVSDNNDSPRRAKIHKLQGVPGLNMILVQYENESEPTKVKKGSVTLIERQALLDSPFQEVAEEKSVHNDNTVRRKLDDDYTNGAMKHDEKNPRDKRNNSYHRSNDEKSHKRKNNSIDHRDLESKTHNKRHNPSSTSSRPADHSPTWLIPNIRVRIVSRKYGSQHYKEKGIVVDVSRTGEATLTMNNGQVIHVSERHLETALPKVGGSTCILTGHHRLCKGKLLQRDSKANQGSVQIYEDLSIVTTSLDDIAEWCGPLDDDLDQPHY